MKKFLFPCFAFFLLSSCGEEKKMEPANEAIVKSASADNDKTAKPMPAEFADARYVDIGKERLQLFAAGDYDKWGEGFADDVVSYWSAGDSLVGKKAVVDYWKDRRAKFIESAQMTQDIWLPVKVNIPQQGPDRPGVWLMCWHQVNVKYKNGKALQFWVHQTMHYNTQDKVDRVITYMDRAPINAALEVK